MSTIPFTFPLRPAGLGRPRLALLGVGLLCALPLAMSLGAMRLHEHHLGVPTGFPRLQVIIHFVLIALIGPALTAGAIASEFERNTWDLLRMTRLTAAQIMSQKLQCILIPALLPTIAFLPAYALDGGALPRGAFLHLLAIALAATSLCLLIGLACSTLSPTTTRAFCLAYLVTCALFLLPFLIEAPSFNFLIALHLSSPLSAALATLGTADAKLLWVHLETVSAACAALLLVAHVRTAALLRTR